MSIRTTITLEDDVIERVKAESRKRGASFKDTINDLLRLGLVRAAEPAKQRILKIKPRPLGQLPGLNYDCIESLIEYAEGPNHR